MLKSEHIFTFAAILSTLSCSSDKMTPPSEPSPYASLESREDVSANLCLAWNKLNYDEVVRVLADDFVFEFSPADVGDSRVGAASWNRNDELLATASMFGHGTTNARSDYGARVTEETTWGLVKDFYSDPNVALDYPVDRVNMIIEPHPNNDRWETVSTPDGNLLKQRVQYFMTISAGNILFTTGSSVAAIIHVRPTEVSGNTVYQLVRWRDDVYQ
jgi:hypothetical protein